MIPNDIRLYTWLDVQDVFERSRQTGGEWPEWLVWVRPYWDMVLLGIKPGVDRNQVTSWLAEQFDPRFDAETGSALLEEGVQDGRRLPFVLEETQEQPPEQVARPSLARPSTLWPPSSWRTPGPLPDDLPPVVTFHSFKGGSGRTVQILGLALALTQSSDSKVLLVDADMEAPGITWLLESRLTQPEISFADFLALVHGDVDPTAQPSIALTADRLQSMLLDNIYVLPAFRSTVQISGLEIRPEHLIQGHTNPYILTEALARLGKALGVCAVLIDLRAGLSELASGLLLDARVHRVLVTTLGAQAVQGTAYILDLLGKRSPSIREDDPLPSLIYSRVPAPWLDHLQAIDEDLFEAGKAFWIVDQPEDREPDVLRLVYPHQEDLLVLSNNWEEVLQVIRRSEIVKTLKPLVDKLPLFSPATIQALDRVTAPGDREEQRRRLEDFANRLIVAETGDLTSFLTIDPLRNLAVDFRSRLPIVVVIGAKGAGKTYTYLQIASRGQWSQFVADVTGEKTTNGPLVNPTLWSINLSPHLRTVVEEAQRNVIRSLGFNAEPVNLTVTDMIRDQTRQNLHEGQWREIWLDGIAWSMGFEVGQRNVGRKLIEHLRSSKKNVVAILDGLEDLFQDLPDHENQQVAVRALLQDVPEWLEQQPQRPLGLVVFIRSDMVLHAVHQNAAQLIKRYEPYALRWNRVEALRLVLWTAIRAGVLPDEDSILQQDWSALTDRLAPLWGRKLGSERSKESRSSEFVVAALSDFRGQIQARDLVRLLYKAAQDSHNDTFWTDRLLTPTAIRGAVKFCGDEKIDEIGQENPGLGQIFSKLKGLSEDNRRVPFTRDQVQLTPEEMSLLEQNGVVQRDKEVFYMPEIYRQGLNFNLTKGGRARVLVLSRKVSQQI